MNWPFRNVAKDSAVMTQGFRTFLFCLLCCFAYPAFSEVRNEGDPAWGELIGNISRTFVGQFDDEITTHRRSYLKIEGESCAHLVEETVFTTDGFLEGLAKDGPQGFEKAELEKILKPSRGFLQPCDDVIFLSRTFRINSPEASYRENFVEGISEGQYLELLEAAGKFAVVSPETDTSPLEQDWGVQVGDHVKLYTRPNWHTASETRPVWLETYGDSCARAVVETFTYSREMWDYANQHRPGRLEAFKLGELIEENSGLLPLCERYRHLHRAVFETGGETEYFLHENSRVKEQEFLNLLENARTQDILIDHKVDGYSSVPSFPNNLDAELRVFYTGQFESGNKSFAERLVASYAFHGIVTAYSEQVNDSSDCRFKGDVSVDIVTTYDDVTSDDAFQLHFPADHRAAIQRAFVGEQNPDLNYWIGEGRIIASSASCRSSLILLMRENTKRYLEGRGPISDIELAAMISTAAAIGAGGVSLRSLQ